jgi:dTDP-4-amino-4,6-dideoxygalactose transaminase
LKLPSTGWIGFHAVLFLWAVFPFLCFITVSRETYEAQFSQKVGVKRAIAFSHARTALWAILAACRIGDNKDGDEVVLSPLTCKVVPLTLLSRNIKLRYADISISSLNLDPSSVKAAIGPKTRAILFQHTYGHSKGVEEIAKLAIEKGIILLEDCAQCLPVRTGRKTPGEYGKAAIFSNNLMKPMPAGSGGLAVTNDQSLADEIQRIRDDQPQQSHKKRFTLPVEIWIHKYLMRPAWYWPLFELNRRLDSGYKVRPLDWEIQSEVIDQSWQVSDYQMNEGMRWLDEIDTLADYRRQCCEEYSNALRGCGHVGQPAIGQNLPLYYYPILVSFKERLLQQAKKSFVEIVSWPTKTPIYPIEKEEDLRKYEYQPGSCPTAEKVAKQLVGLPTHPKITVRERQRIIKLVKTFQS